MSKKIQIIFDDLSLEKIKILKEASRRNSVADVVRDALHLYDWCRRQIAEGFVIVALKPGKEKEVVLPFEGPQ